VLSGVHCAQAEAEKQVACTTVAYNMLCEPTLLCCRGNMQLLRQELMPLLLEATRTDTNGCDRSVT
jgi:hypothetical protein